MNCEDVMVVQPVLEDLNCEDMVVQPMCEHVNCEDMVVQLAYIYEHVNCEDMVVQPVWRIWTMRTWWYSLCEHVIYR